MSKSKPSRISAGRTCILVLGMHRSGTSALAGLLTKLGCEPPANVMPASKGNPKGFFESIVIRDFNDELLASAGSSWDDFTHFPEEWLQSPAADSFLDRAIPLLEQEFGQAPLFVLKDPRICRIVPFWTRALERFGATVRSILTIRNPLEVGHSLRAKKGFGEPLSQMIWLRYVLDAEHATRSAVRFTTSFQQLLQGWDELAASAQEKLQLVWPKPSTNIELDADHLLAEDLRHHKESSARAMTSTLLPQWLRETFEIFRNWAESGESSEDYPQLDRIRSEFDIASSAFARVVRSERDNVAKGREKVRALQADCAALQAKVSENVSAEAQRQQLQKRYSLLESERDDLVKRHSALAAERDNLANRNSALAVERDEFANRNSALAAEHDELVNRYQSVTAESERREQELERALKDLEAAATAERQAAAAAAEQQLRDVKEALQQQRREGTLLRAEVQQAQDATEAVRAELAAAQAESAASRSRRKEMARVITDREAKLEALKQELQARYSDLAMLERRLLRRSPTWLFKRAVRKLRRLFARPLPNKAQSAT